MSTEKGGFSSDILLANVEALTEKESSPAPKDYKEKVVKVSYAGPSAIEINGKYYAVVTQITTTECKGSGEEQCSSGTTSSIYSMKPLG